MTSFFAGDLKNPLTVSDWLCRGCYAEWYRSQRHRDEDDEEESEEEREEKESETERTTKEAQLQRRRTERWLRRVALPLWTAVHYLDPVARPHRSLLVRYITLGQLPLLRLPSNLSHF